MVESRLMSSAASSGEPGWHGHLALQFECDRAQSTRLQQSFARAPLKVQRPFYPEGPEVCHSVMLHTAGGVVGGDRLSVDVQLQPQSRALLTTAAAAKIYGKGRQAQPGLTSHQDVLLQAAAGACVEWLPQETIVFDGARYHQSLTVHLAEDAIWMGWDITRLGRSARGERFQSGEWRSRTEIWQGDRLIWLDPQCLNADSPAMTSRHGLAGHPVVGTFALVGVDVEKDWLETPRHLWIEQQSGSPSEADAGVTRLQSGILCRYRGRSTAEARRWFTAVWNDWRSRLWSRPACAPRVWSV